MDLKQRIYNDFFRPSKEDEYEEILKAAQKAGYEFHTVLSFEDVILTGIKPEKKYLIMRRDVDTGDFKILHKMLDLEKKYGARATYYFRWNTLNEGLMKDISENGGEASYHYEEIATYCYRHHIKSKEKMYEKIETIRDLFVENYFRFKKLTGQKCFTISSHGDYLNTLINCPNKILINDRVRETCGIIREAYDAPHMKSLTCRIADQIEMDSFTEKALLAIENREHVLELLTHPRQWNSPVYVNLKEEIVRMLKGLYMML